jgi:hypothetical protein
LNPSVAGRQRLAFSRAHPFSVEAFASARGNEREAEGGEKEEEEGKEESPVKGVALSDLR